jgi:hypothetical protein
MLGVVAVVQPHRVVEEREEEHDLGVGPIGVGDEIEPIASDTLPVREPVQVRAVRRRAQEHRVEHILDGSERQICLPRR